MYCKVKCGPIPGSWTFPCVMISGMWGFVEMWWVVKNLSVFSCLPGTRWQLVWEGEQDSLGVAKEWGVVLAGWLSWLEHRPIHQKIVCSIPSQSTYQGCGFDLQLGCTWETAN